MGISISKLTSRISISIALSLIGLLALFGARLYGFRTSAYSAKKFSVQMKGDKNPYIILQDGRELQSTFKKQSSDASSLFAQSAADALDSDSARPLALASGDFNVDGFPDLVCGYATPSGGLLTLHAGDREAFSPQNQDVLKGIANGQFPEP